ncbi:hypothetical protein DOY81_000288 [Sarcophaga bullata]|nr:hypothetical protein DOY81_000288 [Sarcophaga bullata]
MTKFLRENVVRWCTIAYALPIPRIRIFHWAQSFSPVPVACILQHSPGSTSNGANDRDESLSVDDDKPRDAASSLSATSITCIRCISITSLLFHTTDGYTATSQFLSFGSLNGNHLHPNYAATAYAVDCTTQAAAQPPKIRVNSPEKLNSAANSIAATLTAVAHPHHHPQHQPHHHHHQHNHSHPPPPSTIQEHSSSPSATSPTTSYHHNTQLLHRPFSTSPDISHSATEIT